MENASLISVIIPVYNVGEFLRPCLDSLIAQTYQNLEILLIDDGSTDGSGLYCDEYTAKDSRFKVTHKKNGGVSSARNLGLDLAQGEYIAFVDADDRVLPDYFEVLFRDITEQQVQAAFCGYVLIDEAGNTIPSQTPRFTKRERITDRNTMVASATNYGIVWGGIIHKGLIGSDRFLGLRYGEDSLFMFDLLCKAPAISQNPFDGYLYLQRANSATTTKEIPNILKARDHLIVHGHRYLHLPESAQRNKMLRNSFLYRYANQFHSVAYMSAQPENCKERDSVRALLKEHLSYLLPSLGEIPKNCVHIFNCMPNFLGCIFFWCA